MFASIPTVLSSQILLFWFYFSLQNILHQKSILHLNIDSAQFDILQRLLQCACLTAPFESKLEDDSL